MFSVSIPLKTLQKMIGPSMGGSREVGAFNWGEGLRARMVVLQEKWSNIPRGFLYRYKSPHVRYKIPRGFLYQYKNPRGF